MGSPLKLVLEFDNPKQLREAIDLFFGPDPNPRMTATEVLERTGRATQSGYESTQSGNEPPPTPARDIAREAAKSLPEMAPAALKTLEDYSDIPPKQAMKEITGTGKHGRILKKDVEAYLREKDAEAKAPAASKAKSSQTGSEAPSEEDAKAALKEMYARVAGEAIRDTARSECKALLGYFGVENAAGVKPSERKLFIQKCQDWKISGGAAPKAEETPAESEKTAESGSEEPEGYTIADCRAAMKELNDKHGMKVCMGLLQEFGVAKIPELKEADYAAFCEQANKLAAQEGAE